MEGQAAGASQATFVGADPEHAVSFHKLSAYARLGKLSIWEHWLPVVVAWSLLEPLRRASAPALAVLGLFALAAVTTGCAGAALDDLQGVRDGLDGVTYGGDDRRRRIRYKPLLLGELTEREALRFALATAGCGLAAAAVAIALAPHRPLWLTVAVLALALAATQYSYGVKLSYVGFGEVLLAIANGATVAMPFILVAGRLSARVGVEALLATLWMLQITVCSSAADADADRAAGRLTGVARLGDGARVRLIATLFVVSILLAAAAIGSRLLPTVAVAALLPTLALQGRQLAAGPLRGDWLGARWIGWRAYDLGVLALILVNLAC
jgi:1,4-dihydroxy-2-naphthoate polyprenyltransferase